MPKSIIKFSQSYLEQRSSGKLDSILISDPLVSSELRWQSPTLPRIFNDLSYFLHIC